MVAPSPVSYRNHHFYECLEDNLWIFAILIIPCFLFFCPASVLAAPDVRWSQDFNGYTYFVIDNVTQFRCTWPPTHWPRLDNQPCFGTANNCSHYQAQSCEIVNVSNSPTSPAATSSPGYDMSFLFFFLTWQDFALFGLVSLLCFMFFQAIPGGG